MQRAIARIADLDDEIKTAAQTSGLVTVGDVLTRSDLELLHLLKGVGMDGVIELLNACSSSAAPNSSTAGDLWDSAAANPSVLPLGLSTLDKALAGGIQVGTITEVVGPAGLGKTQFCLTAAVMAVTRAMQSVSPSVLVNLDDNDNARNDVNSKSNALNTNNGEESIPDFAGGSVLWLDTEGSFSAERLVEIGAKRMGITNPEQQARLAEAVHVERVKDTSELAARLTDPGLQEFMIEAEVALVVVDSVAAAVRREFSSSSLAARQAALVAEAAALKFLAETFSVPVIVANQVTTIVDASGGSSVITAALGTAWAHCVNTRLTLEQSPDPDAPRIMRIDKSPIAPALVFGYRLQADGFVEARLSTQQQQAGRSANATGQVTFPSRPVPQSLALPAGSFR